MPLHKKLEGRLVQIKAFRKLVLAFLSPDMSCFIHRCTSGNMNNFVSSSLEFCVRLEHRPLRRNLMRRLIVERSLLWTRSACSPAFLGLLGFISCIFVHSDTVTHFQREMLQVNLAYEFVKEVDCLDVSLEGTAAWDAAQRRYVLVAACVFPIACS